VTPSRSTGKSYLYFYMLRIYTSRATSVQHLIETTKCLIWTALG